jgi:pyruvate/2-oxoglutarate dehydrogenase complex dihydrolipoamide dehydrogenase (E3) component
VGLGTSLTAQAWGKTAVMAESRTIGGTCVIEGCPGSNNLIEAAKPGFDARHPRYPGLALADEDLRANSRQLVAQKSDAVEGYRQKIPASLAVIPALRRTRSLP